MKFFFSSFFIVIIVICVFIDPAFAQLKYTFSGTVKNAESGEVLISAIVNLKEIKTVGTSTNDYGFYSLTAEKGNYTVQVQYIGFKKYEYSLALNKNQNLNIELTPQPIRVSEIVISGERTNKNVVSTEMGTTQLDMQEVKSVPVLLGERDILKTIQLFPGIKSAGEAGTGFYARGGKVDQNLIMLDEAPVYNSSHLLGFLSVFNSDAIKDAKVMIGDIPAEFGGRLSSVLDIHTNDGNMKEYTATGGIGLIASRLAVEGPIVKDEGSFIVTGRRTYADLFLKLSSDTLINRTSLYFYDLNVKANYRLGNDDRVFISGYLGRDNFDYTNVFGFNFGNATTTLRWNHIYGNQLFSNTSLIYSDYEYSNNIGAGTNQYVISSGIQDVNLKTDFQYFMNSENTIKFGLNAIYHTFIPGSVTASPGSPAFNRNIDHKYALENAIYFSHELNLFSDIKLNYGARLSSFSQIGPGNIYTYDNESDIIDSATYRSGQIVKTYFGFEPRISLNYLIDESSSIKASYTRTSQYLHLLSNSTISNPSDLWIPSTNNVKPQYADQISAGYYRNFADNEYEAHVEVYYKNMQNIIDYKNGADLLFNPIVESLLTYGRGWSYGAEFLVKKKFGKFSGWLGYTLAKSEEQFAAINHGQVFPARQDRTHDISIVGIYNYNDRWTFSAIWVYYTGNAVTFPSGMYIVDGHVVPYYTERNGYRMPAYHRLDLSVTYTFNPKSNLNFSLYNAYDRANAYAISFIQDRNDPLKTQAVQLTLFPIIPSVTWNFIF